MSTKRRLEDRIVAGVCEGRPVQLRVVGQGVDRAHPDGLMSDALARDLEVDRRLDMPDVEGATSRPEVGDRMVDPREHLGRAWQRLRFRQPLGHGDLVVEAVILGLEGRDHRQDRLSPLIGLRPSRGEGAAVMDAIDREGDRMLGITRSQEIAVHRVHRAVGRNRATRRDKGLREHLASEDPTARSPLTGTGEDVLAGARLGVGQIERGEQPRHGVGLGVGHGFQLTRPCSLGGYGQLLHSGRHPHP